MKTNLNNKKIIPPLKTTAQNQVQSNNNNKNNNNLNFSHIPNSSIKKLKETKESKQLFSRAIKEINEAFVKSVESSKKLPTTDSNIKQIKQNKSIKQVINQAVKILNDSLLKMKDESLKVAEKPNTRSNLVSRDSIGSNFSDTIELDIHLLRQDPPMSPITDEIGRKSNKTKSPNKNEDGKSAKSTKKMIPATTIRTGVKPVASKKKNENEVDSYADEYYKKNVQVAVYRDKIHQSAKELVPYPGTKPLLDPLAIVQRPEETLRRKLAIEAKIQKINKDPTIHDVLYGMRDKGKEKSMRFNFKSYIKNEYWVSEFIYSYVQFF